MSTARPLSDELEMVASRAGTPTWEIAHLYPHQGEWTEEEYLGLGTNWMIEFTDGCLEFLPMPTGTHQLIVEYLMDRLRRHFKRLRIRVRPLQAPLALRLRRGKFREPDILCVRPEQFPDPRRHAVGADLVMEVVSPGEKSRQRDLKTKRLEYARAGIPEYWIVDPEQRRITVLTLDGRKYRVHGEFGPGTRARSVLFPQFSVSVNQVFAAGESVF